MSAKATETYVTEVLALQGVGVPPEAARPIAATLSAQLAAAEAGYAALAFDVEPATFLVALGREQP
jgi:hypothetical protein